MMRNKKILVLLSGGVDSAVCAHLLQKDGYDVTGCFLSLYTSEITGIDTQCIIQDKRDAMRVCAHLDIPFVSLDVAHDYESRVLRYFYDEYHAGRTPNPDVMCNREIKFGIGYDYAREHGFDAIATGHYARVVRSAGRAWLAQAIDTTKDQSYFLWTLAPEVLEYTLFPLGNLLKTEVRAIASRAGLPVAQKKDSQGICFLGAVSVREFLMNKLGTSSGNIISPDGTVLGTHEGVWFSTIGQKAGIGGGETYMVSEKRIATQELVVVPQSVYEAMRVSTVEITDAWLAQGGMPTHAVCRYHGSSHPVERVEETGEGGFRVHFNPGIPLYAPGQSMVFYDADGVCVGGGYLRY